MGCLDKRLETKLRLGLWLVAIPDFTKNLQDLKAMPQPVKLSSGFGVGIFY